MEDNALTKTMKNLSIFFKKKSKVNINNFLKKFILNKKISGPEILRKNLIKGLRKNLVSFDINPNLDNVKNKCLVLDDVEILAQLIKIKEKKNIEIIAGPNLMIMPDEYNKILFRDEINKIIVPCDWVKKKYIEVSKSHLKNKIKIWAAGVDHKYWKPGKNKSIDVLLYSKFIRNDKIFEKCFKYLKNRKYRVKIIEYGNYDQKKYLNLLKKSKVAVFFSESESQGLAYFEAWSTNVPTLIYNPKKIYRKPYKTKTDSCPYLNQKLGKDFYTFKSFKIEFQNFFNSKNFKPRSEIIKNFTIEKTAEKLSKII